MCVKIASDPNNLDLLGKTLKQNQKEIGLQAYYFMISKSEQLWVYVLQNQILNAGRKKGTGA